MDECAEEIDDCDNTTSTCADREGRYECVCNEGYQLPFPLLSFNIEPYCDGKKIHTQSSFKPVLRHHLQTSLVMAISPMAFPLALPMFAIFSKLFFPTNFYPISFLRKISTFIRCNELFE